MLDTQKTRYSFLVLTPVFVSLLVDCTTTPVKPASPHLTFLSAPTDTVLSVGETKHFAAQVSTNSKEPVHYLWQKLAGSTEKTISNIASIELSNKSGTSCSKGTDSYRLIAHSGALRAEKTFSVTRACAPRRGNPNNDAISTSPPDHVWVSPGQQVALSAATKLQGATLTWEMISDTSPQVVSDNGQYIFTAPQLAHPCDEQVFSFKATATLDGTETSKTISVNVENPGCHLSVANGLVSDDTTKLLIAKDGALFVGTRNGLTRYKDGQTQNATTAGNNETLQIVTALGQSDSLIFVGKARKLALYPTKGFGIDILQVQDSGFFWNNTPLYTNDYVSHVYFNPKTPNLPEVLAARNITTPGGVHLSADLSFKSTADILQGENIYAAVDYKGMTYFGGDGGIFVVKGHAVGQRFDGSQWQGKGGFLGMASNRSVRALAKDSGDNIWIGLQAGVFEEGGLVRYQPATGTWEGPIKLPGGQDVRALAVDSNDNLWIATDNGLTERKANGEFKNFAGEHGLQSSDIRDLAYSPEKENLWIATGAGVTRWSLAQLR